MKSVLSRMFVFGGLYWSTLLSASVTDYQLATWNIQGAGSGAASNSKWVSGIANMFLRENIQVVAIQEAGARPPSACPYPSPGTPGGIDLQRIAGGAPNRVNPQRRGVISDVEESLWQPGGRRGGNIYIYHIDHDTNAHRVNIAIASRIRADEVLIIPPLETGPNARPTLGIRIGNDYFFSLHAGAHQHNEAAMIVQFIDNYMANSVLPRRAEATWILMGDFNQSPDSLRASLSLPGTTMLNTYHVVDPNVPTHQGGNTLDYAVLGAATGTVRLFAVPLIAAMMTYMSDHIAVRFNQ
ncbi:hypothetical protein PL78_18445 [Yersinia entomophaga]|uniref:Endonuclease/exonuclease/phosphatase domain-containing protein n=1 Tax=Yersinia entomophaga TaxID=935293 RepID=A0ABM6BR26_YERET|nr:MULTISPECIES: cytolethal distending toxin subunit B family protein [Yersinia]ANI31790.1 hypothetical protein PL78_18445 [Yersinia entomophaga]OWF85978.1 hypothetical protein B4914_16050 [Yersinia entomophaga]